MSRDGDANIPYSSIFQRLIFSLLKPRVLFPIGLCLASVSGHWFSLFLGQINLFIIIHIDIQLWHSYPVFSALPEIWIDEKGRLACVWKRQTSLCVKKGNAQLEKRLQHKTPIFFKERRQQYPQRCSVFRDCSLSLNFSPPAPCWRAASLKSLPTAASGENTFPSPGFLDGGSKFIPRFATFQRETYNANLFQCCFVGLLLSAEVAAENHTSVLMRNSEKLKDLSIGV